MIPLAPKKIITEPATCLINGFEITYMESFYLSLKVDPNSGNAEPIQRVKTYTEELKKKNKEAILAELRKEVQIPCPQCQKMISVASLLIVQDESIRCEDCDISFQLEFDQ
jgi:hypothetical protein